MELSSGTLVRDNVRLIHPLGEGGMGSVWVAQHLTLNTQVAVKFLSERVADDNPEALARFHREASTGAQLKSPYVMRTFDQGVMADGTPFIVMELLEGETLAELLERMGWLGLGDVSVIVTQLGKALNSAHKRGIVHRDIKPDNVFLSEHDDGMMVKVFDFGIAKSTQLPKLHRLTSGGIMLGTPEYMSPEQVMNSRDVDYRADLWAFAVVVYEMVCGELPFSGEDIGALCYNLLRGKFIPPRELRAELPQALDGWFDRALHEDPDERFRSAKEMALGFVQHVPARFDELEEELLETGEYLIPTIPAPKKDEDQPASRPTGRPRPVTFSGTTTRQPAPAQPGSRRVILVAAAAALVGLVATTALLMSTSSDESPGAGNETSPAQTAPDGRDGPSPNTAAENGSQSPSQAGTTQAFVDEPDDGDDEPEEAPDRAAIGKPEASSPPAASSWQNVRKDGPPPKTKPTTAKPDEEDPGF